MHPLNRFLRGSVMTIRNGNWDARRIRVLHTEVCGTVIVLYSTEDGVVCFADRGDGLATFR
jgi:hypothetical protein